MSKAEVGLLNDAFFEFNRVSESLISHYGSLEGRIKELKNQIEDKNFQLENVHTYLQDILDSLPVGVVVLDENHSALFINRRAGHVKSVCVLDDMRNGEHEIGELKDGDRRYRWWMERLSNGFEGKEVLVIEDVTELERLKEHFERVRATGEMAPEQVI